MRVVLMATPDFSVPTLRALVVAGHDVICAYTQPPRPAGRGKRERPSPVQLCAEEMGIEVRMPASFNPANARADFSALRADIAVVVAYGLLLPQAVLEAPDHGCLNIHASLLPRWRGAAPIHRAVMAGDDRTGICIMRMEAGLDTGPVLLRGDVPIGPSDTTGDLHDRLSALGARMIINALADLTNLTPRPQDEDGVTYARKIDKAEARVDWSLCATGVDRRIRGLSPVPGAWCDIAGERVKLLRSRLAAGAGQPGEVLHGFTIACGRGAVEVLEVQRPGRRPASAEDALRGMTLPARLD